MKPAILCCAATCGLLTLYLRPQVLVRDQIYGTRIDWSHSFWPFWVLMILDGVLLSCLVGLVVHYQDRLDLKRKKKQ